MRNDCPHCGSDDTQKVSVIFESRTSVIDTKASHVAFAGGHAGTTPIVGATRQKGTQQTSLAARHAPPQRGTPVKTMLAALLLGPMLAGIVTFGYGFVRQVAEVDGNPFAYGKIVFWSVYGLLVLLAIGASTEMHKFNRDQYPGLIAEWNAKWLCHRCGESFVPEGQVVAAAVSRSAAASPKVIHTSSRASDNAPSLRMGPAALGIGGVLLVGIMILVVDPFGSAVEDIEREREMLERHRRAQLSASPAVPAPQHHPRPEVETVPPPKPRASKIVASLQQFQAGLPLLAEGKLSTIERDGGINHVWNGPSGNVVVFYDDGADGVLDEVRAAVAIPTDDRNRQVVGIGLAYRLIELASGQTLNPDGFSDSVVIPAIEQPLTKWFGETRINVRVLRTTDDLPRLVMVLRGSEGK